MQGILGLWYWTGCCVGVDFGDWVLQPIPPATNPGDTFYWDDTGIWDDVEVWNDTIV